MFVSPGVHPGFLQQEARPFGDFGNDRSSSGSWGTQFSEGEAFSSSGQAEPDFKGERGSPLSHFQALEQVSLASLRLDDRASVDDNRFAPQHGEQQSVGWGGRPLQHQQRFKQQRGEEYGYHQMQRRGPHYPRGKQPAPNQRASRGGHDGRVKNQGYRRLWQQVTQVGRGQKLGESDNIPFSEMTVEDLLEIVRRLPPEASAVKAIVQGLYFFDSGALAALLKELNKSGHARRAQEVFDWLRTLDETHDLYSLCTTMTYTTMISQCGSQQQLRRALELVAEMRSRGIQCNVHTYSALMNVCIKANELDLALDVYRQMLAEGCNPNLVTYNTLIDVYGKTGSWEEAVRVLDTLEQQGIDPEIRTYNTVIIACNMSGQAQEALRIYERMLAAGAQPTATTYTALISAYGKNGQLDRALQIFQDMVRRGCERNVITYSSLISACEKAGRWELALELFREMHTEGCRPNVVTYNSLIAACAQGAQWEKAQELFETMQAKGCKPDSVTFGGLIAAYDRAGHWRRALTTYEQMRAHNCRPDSVVYNTIVGALWKTGLVWAQAKATQIFQLACRQGHFRLTVHTLDAASAAASSSSASSAPQSATGAATPPLVVPPSAALSGSASGSGRSSCDGRSTPDGHRVSLDSCSVVTDASPMQAAQESAASLLSESPLPGGMLSNCPSGSLTTSLSLGAASLAPSTSANASTMLAGSPGGVLSEESLAAAIAAATAGGATGAGTIIEFGMHAFTVGSAVLSVLRWVAELQERLPREPNKDLRHSVCLVLNKGKPSREHTFPAIKTALLAMLRAWKSPFTLTDVAAGCRIEALACDITCWLHTPQADAALAAFSHRADSPRSLNKDAYFSEDLAVETRCAEAMAAVRMFEGNHPTDAQELPGYYLEQRRDWFTTSATYAAALGLKDEVVVDSMLLLDRALAVGGEGAANIMPALLILTCLLISARQGEHPDRLPSTQRLEQVTGLPPSALEQAQSTVRQLLGNDTAAISAVRVIKLFLERLGADFGHAGALRAVAGPALGLVTEVVCERRLLGTRPSLLAAAALLAARQAEGLTPFWPQALVAMTGFTDEEGGELASTASLASEVLAGAASRGLVI